MWFFLGLVAFTLSAIYFYNQKIGQPNQYKSFKSFNLGGKIYRANNLDASNNFRLGFFKNKRVLEVVVEVNTKLRFVLSPENKLDRWAKKVGLSVEPQTGNDFLDEAFYLVCHDDFVAEKLNDSTFEKSLFSLLERQFLNDYAYAHGAVGRFNQASLRLTEVRSTGQFFCVKYAVLEPIEPITPIQEKLAELCFEVATTLNHYQDNDGYQWWKDKNHYKSAFFLAISSGLGAMGLFEYFRMSVNSEIQTVLNFTPLNIIWLASTPVILSTMIACVIFGMRRSAITHIIVKDMLLVGGLGLSVYTYSIIYDINMLFDDSKALTHTSFVLDKKTIRTTGKHARTYHKVYFSPPLKFDIQLSDLNVEYKLFYNLNKNDCLSIIYKSGFLKAAWIEKIEKRDGCQKE